MNRQQHFRVWYAFKEDPALKANACELAQCEQAGIELLDKEALPVSSRRNC